jgi:hypothetical protein
MVFGSIYLSLLSDPLIIYRYGREGLDMQHAADSLLRLYNVPVHILSLFFARKPNYVPTVNMY